MRWNILLFTLVFFVFVLSCAPQTEDGERGAVVGLAISKGCYDADNDGYGRSGRAISSCFGSSKLFDCNDNNATVNPGASEICGNRIDDNCNRRVDEAGCVAVCTPAREICDGVDNDCDGIIDGPTICNHMIYCGGPGVHCLESQACVDGMCVECEDSDPPNDIYIGGTLSAGSLVITDYCQSLGVVQASCDGAYSQGINIDDSIACPSGTTCRDADGQGGAPAYCAIINATLNVTNLCGNGIIEPNEICDDGNTIDGDSCSQCTCLDSDVSSSNPYTVRGNVTNMNASGGVVINYDYCDPEGTDIFEYACDGNRVYATDYSCTGLDSEYRCIDHSNDLGYPRDYSGYCG